MKPPHKTKQKRESQHRRYYRKLAESQILKVPVFSILWFSIEVEKTPPDIARVVHKNLWSLF